MKRLFVLIGMLFFFSAPAAYGTLFQNGDFEAGFQGWGGIVTDSFFNDQTVDPGSDNHFSIVSNSGPENSNVAQVQNDATYWLDTLLQDFTLDPLPSGYTMDITFWIKWSPTDSDYDAITATITSTGSQDSVDLLLGVPIADLVAGTWITQDITTFAENWGGQDVELAFSIADWDGNTPDSFQLDSISFNQHGPTPVPLPGSFLIVVSGLLGLGAGRRWRRRA